MSTRHLPSDSSSRPLQQPIERADRGPIVLGRRSTIDPDRALAPVAPRPMILAVGIGAVVAATALLSLFSTGTEPGLSATGASEGIHYVHAATADARNGSTPQIATSTHGGIHYVHASSASDRNPSTPTIAIGAHEGIHYVHASSADDRQG